MKDDLERTQLNLVKRNPVELDKFKVGKVLLKYVVGLNCDRSNSKCLLHTKLYQRDRGASNYQYRTLFIVFSSCLLIGMKINDRKESSNWIQLTQRRLKTYGGTPSLSGTQHKPLPRWVDEIIDAIEQSNIKFTNRLDHVLLNEYSGNCFLCSI